MTDLEVLSEMIKDTARETLHTTKYGKNSVILKEPQCPECSVTINGIPSDAVVVKVDVFISPNNMFSGAKGEGSRADYVIIADMNGKKRIVYIEMKKTKGDRKVIIKQLLGARCFVLYCQEIGKCFWGEKKFLDGYEERFVSFGHISISKRKTRIDRLEDKHNKPEKMMKIDWPHNLQFAHLAGS